MVVKAKLLYVETITKFIELTDENYPVESINSPEDILHLEQLNIDNGDYDIELLMEGGNSNVTVELVP